MNDYPVSDADTAMYKSDRRNAQLYAAWYKVAAARTAHQAAVQAARAHYEHHTSTGTVLLGNRALADAQRAADEADGGLVARICGYGRNA